MLSEIVEDTAPKIIGENIEENEITNSEVQPSSDPCDSTNQESDSSEWESWDGEEESDTELKDEDLNDEIEKELQSMPTTIASKQSQDRHLSYHSQHSNQTPATKLKSALKLSGKSKEQNTPRVHFVDQNQTNVDKSLMWDQAWDNKSQSYDTKILPASVEAVTAEHGTAVNAVHVRPVTTSSNVPLGSEFDVKSIEIKTKSSSELDFFADMVPEIKTVNKDPLALIVSETSMLKESQDLEEKTTDTQTVSFAVLSTTGSTVSVYFC